MRNNVSSFNVRYRRIPPETLREVGCVEMSCLNFDIKTEEDEVPGTDADSVCSYDSSGAKCQSQSENQTSTHRKMRKIKRLNVKRTYGLRPRTQLRRPSYECELEYKELQATPKKEPSGKVRGSIVAKTRRLTANARERQRMKEINDAFVTLQGILPALEGRRQPSTASARASMTKIRTLRHAASYIQALSDLLSGSETPLQKDFTQYNRSSDPNSQSCSYSTLCNNNNTLVDPTEESLKAEEKQLSKQDQQCSKSPSCNSLSWNEVEATDEELFSLLEKEVMSMRKNSINEGTDCGLGGINWSDDLPPIG